MTEDFFEFCTEGSLAIEVYGHLRQGRRKDTTTNPENEGRQGNEGKKGEDAVASVHNSITQKNKHLIDKSVF